MINAPSSIFSLQLLPFFSVYFTAFARVSPQKGVKTDWSTALGISQKASQVAGSTRLFLV